MNKNLLSEFIGTYALVFFGCGAMVIDSLLNGLLTHLGVNAVFGIIIMILIYSFGDISGAHFNPAVSIAFYTDGQIPLKTTIYYSISQILGATFGALTLKLMFPSAILLGNTIPSFSHAQVFFAEFIFSFFLFLIIINVSEGPKEKGIMAGLAIGAYIFIAGMINGPLGGNSLNPARTIGPALISMNFQGLYIYMIAPILGTLLAARVARLIRN